MSISLPLSLVSLGILVLQGRCQDTGITAPADYTDDVYHCKDPQQVALAQTDSYTISCDLTTWRWNVDELEEDSPPALCLGIDRWEALQGPVDDMLEPCLLWLMNYDETTEITLRNVTDPGLSPVIPDDVFHCRDLSSIREDSISCDPSTLEWNLAELSEARPPGICPRDFTIPPEEVPNVQDWFEPCVLWAMVYGNLQPTPSPVEDFVNTTAVPTMQPTSNTITNDTFPPTDDLTRPPLPTNESSNVVVVDPILLTFVWPANTLFEENLSIDRRELRMITEQHVLEALQAELGLTLVTAVNLILTSGLPTSNSVTETVTGTVSLNARIPSVTVQRLVQAAFQKNALELYLFRLSISTDPALKQVQTVIVGTNIDFDNMGPGASPSTESDDQSMDTVMVAVIAAVGAALVAVCCLGLCILLLSKRRSEKGPSDKGAKEPQKGSVASASKASRPRISAPAAQATIPPVPTKSLSNEEYPPIYEDDEEYQMSLISMSEMDEQSRVAHDEQSVTTSVYSYFNNDEMSLLGGASDASSFFNPAPSSTRNEDVNANKNKGTIWNVRETMKHHFGSDSEFEEDERNRRPNILGPTNDYDSDHGSNNSGNLLYTAKQPPKIEVDEEEVEDYDSEFSQQGTPVRERLERMWREEDAKEDISVNSDPNEIIIPPPKIKGLMVFQDDNSGNNSHSNSVGGSCATDESPVPSVLLDVDNVGSAPPLAEIATQEVTRIVNRIPNGQDEDDLDDDDQKMAVPLPSQLMTVDANAADPHNDNASQNSRLSDRSTASGRSNGSHRNPFGANKSNAQSVRVKREKSWGKSSIASNDSQSVASVHSTDSAKYRSLLNQGDTNDAALFGLMTETTKVEPKTVVSPDSALKATRLSYEQDDNKAKTSNSRAQLSTLIKSFDDVWAQEEKNGSQRDKGQKGHLPKGDLQDSSDEDDIYVGGDDDDNDDNNQSDSESLKSGASRAVQGLSSLLTNPNGESALTMNDKKKLGKDAEATTERKLSFEIQDSSSDEDEADEKKDEFNQEPGSTHMERTRRRSHGGCADSTASF